MRGLAVTAQRQAACSRTYLILYLFCVVWCWWRQRVLLSSSALFLRFRWPGAPLFGTFFRSSSSNGLWLDCRRFVAVRPSVLVTKANNSTDKGWHVARGESMVTELNACGAGDRRSGERGCECNVWLIVMYLCVVLCLMSRPRKFNNYLGTTDGKRDCIAAATDSTTSDFHGILPWRGDMADASTSTPHSLDPCKWHIALRRPPDARFTTV